MRRRHLHAAADAHGLPSLAIKIPRLLMANRPKTVTQALLFVEILSLLPTRRWMDLEELHAALALTNGRAPSGIACAPVQTSRTSSASS